MNSLGIFLNNTDSEIKVTVNINNFNNLKNNFKNIIIIDINNIFSQKLNNNLIKDKNIIKYILDNYYIKNDLNDLDFNKFNNILHLLNISEFKNFQYITFINDNYIYCNDLKKYFTYINIHNLDFSSYNDSSEYEYHYQLYLFSIKYNLINKLIDFIKSENNNNLLYKIHTIFNIKMPFLKIAYIKNNIDNNIFYNNSEYKELILSNLLPIVNLDYILNIKNNFKNYIYDKIPLNFDKNIYRKNNDLINYSDAQLEDHFLSNGQFEFRNYTDELFILPVYIRKLLKESNILEFFDVPDNFNILKYLEKNNDLKNLNMRELLIHWIEYGNNESRLYN